MRELHANRVQFSHVRVFSDSHNVQKSVTRIMYLGPLPSGQSARSREGGLLPGKIAWYDRVILFVRKPAKRCMKYRICVESLWTARRGAAGNITAAGGIVASGEKCGICPERRMC